MNETAITIISSVASAIIGALIGGFITFLIEKKKLKTELMLEKKKETKLEYEKRPRLELREFKSISEGKLDSDADLKCVFLNFDKPVTENKSLTFRYDDRAVDINNLCCVEYVFENTGETEIDSVCLVSNQPKTTSLIELEHRSLLITNKILCYEAWADKRFIKPGEKISFKVCYLKDKVMISPISSVAVIYLQDVNGNLWHQALFCPTNEIENSTRSSFEEFKNNRDTTIAMECFKKPYLW